MADASPRTLALTLLGAGLLALAPSEALAMKCRNASPEGGPLLLVDGRLITELPAEGAGTVEAHVGTLDVERILIVCWNPETGTPDPAGSRSGIYVLTKGFIGEIYARLDAVVEAQPACFETWRSGRVGRPS